MPASNDTRELPPLSLYVHIPWCVRKCPYCDFNSHASTDDLPEREYVDALLDDLNHEQISLHDRVLQSIFIGGGTPSLFSAEAIDHLLSGLRTRLQLEADVEITLEANPGTVERGRFAEYRAAGINRLSIGIQSFQDELLDRIGRIHNGRDVIRAAEQAHDAGFGNFNLDLMYGLPGQTPAQSQADLRNAIDLEPAHLSWYQLTLEPNTAFHHQPPTLPDEGLMARIQTEGQELLAGSDFMQYEVSAYARAHSQCRHNLNYWQFGDYLGLGAGAHGKLSTSLPDQVWRNRKHRHPQRYLQAMTRKGDCADNPYLSSRVELETADLSAEFMLNALRLKQGVDLMLFERHTGLDPASLSVPLERALQAGLIEQDGHLRASERGWRYLDDLVALFLPA